MALRANNAHYKLASIQTRHWQTLARQSGAGDAFDAMVALVQNAPAALQQVERALPPGFPERLWKTVAAGVRAQCQRFEAGLASTSHTP